MMHVVVCDLVSGAGEFAKWFLEGCYKALEQLVQLDNVWLGFGIGCFATVTVLALYNAMSGKEETKFVVYDPDKGAIYLQQASVLSSPDEKRIEELVAEQVAKKLEPKMLPLPAVVPSPGRRPAVTGGHPQERIVSSPARRGDFWGRKILNLVFPPPKRRAARPPAKKARRPPEKVRRRPAKKKFVDAVLGKPKRRVKELDVDVEPDLGDMDL